MVLTDWSRGEESGKNKNTKAYIRSRPICSSCRVGAFAVQVCPSCRPRAEFLLLKLFNFQKIEIFFQIMRITGIDCHVLLVPDLKEDATSSAQVDSPRHSLYLRFLAVVAFDFFISDDVRGYVDTGNEKPTVI